MRPTKTRISLSISPSVLEGVDSLAKDRGLSRSDAVERILSGHVLQQKKCVILAGGPPQHLKAGDTYRPLLRVKGKTLIEHQISQVKKAGYNHVIIIGAKEVLSEVFRVIGEQGITYIEEKKHLHTAKTLQLAAQHINSTFLFLPCDHYFELDLKDMESYHHLNKKPCTLAVYSGTDYEWKKSSVVRMEGNLILDYMEAPKYLATHLTSLLIGFAEPSIFDSIPSAEMSYSLQKDVFPELAKHHALVGYLYSGKWANLHAADDAKAI